MTKPQVPSRPYYAPSGGHPPQTDLLTGRAVFTAAYAVIPKGVMYDIVASYLPFWEGTRLWVLSRPLSGFAETFSQYIMDVAPGGGSDRPESDPRAEGVLFVVEGELDLTLAGRDYTMIPGGYAYIPPGSDWQVRNRDKGAVRFHWIRKAYEAVDGIGAPDAFVVNENDIAPTPMPGTEGQWATTRFADPADLRHDMHVTIVTFGPGAVIPFAETHVMEHGLYVLAKARLINAGTCKRFHALATVETRGGDARAVVSLFRAEPTALPLHLSMMERHPLGSQAFWPLSGGDWLVAVAPDENGLPGAPLVFRASEHQGVCYAPNVWHHPLIALGRVSDFLVVDRDGPGLNLEESRYVTPHTVGA